MRVLIADDDKQALSFLKGCLRAWGHTVTTACDGLAAIRALLRDPDITVAILNWMMPQMDGWQVSRQIKANGGGNIHTIVVVGVPFRKVTGEAFGLWADDYVGKPFNTKELRASLDAAAGAVRASRRDDRAVPLPEAGPLLSSRPCSNWN